MTTRKQLHGLVRTAIFDDLNAQLRPESGGVDHQKFDFDDDYGLDWGSASFAAIEAVYKVIGDHQLGQMIGDTGDVDPVRRERVVTTHEDEASGIEMLQDGEDS